MTDELTDEELSRMKPARDVLKPETFARLNDPDPYEKKAREIACDWNDCPKGPGAKHAICCDVLASVIASALREAAEGENEKQERVIMEVMVQRDKAQEDSYDLALGIADILGVDIGEHTSHNDPIANAKSYLGVSRCHATSSRAEQSVSREGRALQSNSEGDA